MAQRILKIEGNIWYEGGLRNLSKQLFPAPKFFPSWYCCSDTSVALAKWGGGGATVLHLSYSSTDPWPAPKSSSLIAPQSHSPTVAQSHGHTVPQSHSLIAPQSHSPRSTASQPHSSTMPEPDSDTAPQRHSYTLPQSYRPTAQQSSSAAARLHSTLPPPCANTGQVLVPGPKVRKHGVPVFGQARVSARHVLRNTSCRHSATLTTPT